MSALVPYLGQLYFPGGGPASGALVTVGQDGSNVPAALYADQAGTLPTGPVVACDSDGWARFWASPGLWYAELAGDRFRMDVDPVWPELVRPDIVTHQQDTPSAVWTVDHFFGTSPCVLVQGVVDAEVAQVSFPSPTRTVISFSSAQTGTAILRR